MHMITLLIFGSLCLVLAISESVTTVYRCCPPGRHLTNERCEESQEPWLPDVYTSKFTRQLTPEEVEGLFAKQLNFVNSQPHCKENERRKTVFNPTSEYLFLENGTMWYDGDILHSGSFCLDRTAAVLCEKVEEEPPLAIHEAEPAQHTRKVYINKCCFDWEVYSIEDYVCKGYSDAKELTVMAFLTHTSSLNVLNVTNTFLKYGFPRCTDGIISTGRLSDHNSSLQQDGSLYLPTAKVFLQPNTFCLEYLLEKQDIFPTIYTCPEYMPTPVNGSHIAPDKFDLRLIIYPPGLFLSVFFLAATLAVGCLLPTTHHMLHWRCQTCHVACLMVADFLLAVTYIAGHNFSPVFCSITGMSYNYKKNQ